DDHKHLLRQELFKWSEREGQEGWLRAKAIQLEGQALYLKTYRYDSKGNVARITLYGNLTGEKAPSFSIHEREKMDHSFIEYTYNERNLLTQKRTPEGLDIFYDYLPNTNLCTKVLQAYNGRIQERRFFTYDDNGEIIASIEDNGSATEVSSLADVTFR